MDKDDRHFDQRLVARGLDYEGFQGRVDFQGFQNSSNTPRTTPAISNLISNVQGLAQGENQQTRDQIALSHHAIDATLLENFGNQTIVDPSLLMIEEAHKRKEVSESPVQNKRQKRLSSEEPLSDEYEEQDNSFDDVPQYEFHWPSPSVEPLPISVTLPFIRAFANKKFDAPIPLFVPPVLPVGNLHHFPAMLTMSPFLTLPTAIPLYPQTFMPSFGYYPYNDDLYSEEESEGDDSFEEGDEVVAESMMHNQPQISPLTTLASLASGTVKSQTHL